MGRQTKVKTKAISVGQQLEGHEDMINMFNQMLGEGAPNVPIVSQKIHDMKEQSFTIIKLIRKLTEQYIFTKHKIQEAQITQMLNFCSEYEKKLNDVYVDIFAYRMDYSDIPEEEIKRFSKIYSDFKEDTHLKRLIFTCRNLSRDKAHLENKSYKFIESYPGNDYSPLEFSNMNFKEIIIDDVSEQIREYIILWLYLMYKKTHELYEKFTAPDVDLDEFVEVILGTLRSVKSRIPRCEKGFKKLENSVNLLKTNFGTYYKDFISSKNPNIIIESFIVDVAESSANVDPQLASQLGSIVAFFRKNTRGKINDPKLKVLFDQVNSKFDMMNEELCKEAGVDVNLNEESDENEPCKEESDELASPE